MEIIGQWDTRAFRDYWSRSMMVDTYFGSPGVEFSKLVSKNFFCLPRMVRATDYINDCWKDGELPDQIELYRILLPWLSSAQREELTW